MIDNHPALRAFFRLEDGLLSAIAVGVRGNPGHVRIVLLLDFLHLPVRPGQLAEGLALRRFIKLKIAWPLRRHRSQIRVGYECRDRFLTLLVPWFDRQLLSFD